MIQKIAVGCLAALLCVLGYFAYTYAGHDDQNKGLYAPNVMHKIQKPPITGGDQTEKDAIAAALREAKPLYINGKEIILVPVKVREPSKEEWIRIDSERQSRRQMDQLYNVHEP